MTLLVVGRGAEGTTRELGRAIVALRAAGRPVQAFDPVSAERSCLTGDPEAVLSWGVQTWQPQAILFVGAPDEQPLLFPMSVPAIRLAETTGIAVLGVLAGEVDSGDDDSVLPGVRALAALMSSAPELQVVGDRTPRVSIVAAFYNLAPFTHEVMRSSLDQTFGDCEVVAVDDGSTDETARILQTYAGHPRVRIVTQPNLGGSGRMDIVWNQAAEAARGDLIAYVGGDDINLPDRIAAQVAAFDADASLDVCHGAAETIDPHGKVLDPTWQLWKGYDDFSFLRGLIRSNLVGHPSVMLRREAFLANGMMEDGLAGDYHFWLKTAGRLRYRYLPRKLVQYRLHPQALSTTPAGFEKTEREAVRLRARLLDERPLRDFFPELGDGTDEPAATEASIALGNSVIHADAGLALRGYRHAVESGSADALHNCAIAHALAGDAPAAFAAARAGAAVDESVKPLLVALESGGTYHGGLRTPRSHLVHRILRSRQENASVVKRWDGTSLKTRRAYVAVAPARDDLIEAALDSWVRLTRSGDDVRWVLPTLGDSVESVFDRVVGSAGGRALQDAADITIERVDDIGMLPPPGDNVGVLPASDDEWMAGVLHHDSDLPAFLRWMSSPGPHHAGGRSGPMSARP